MTFNLHFSLCLRTWNFQELNIQYCRIMYSFYENNDAIYFIYGNRNYTEVGYLFIYFIFCKEHVTKTYLFSPLFIMHMQRNRGQIHSLPLYCVLPHRKNYLSYCFPRNDFATISLKYSFALEKCLL